MTVEQHWQKHTVTEYVFYGSHDDRTTSYLFLKNKRKLVKEMGIGCFVCKGHDRLKGHHLVEWSLWGSMDPKKVLQAWQVFDPYGFTKKDPETLPDSPDDIRNLLVLCDKHHRGEGTGVHALTFPIWFALHCVKDGVSITQAIKEVKKKDKELETVH